MISHPVVGKDGYVTCRNLNMKVPSMVPFPFITIEFMMLL